MSLTKKDLTEALQPVNERLARIETDVQTIKQRLTTIETDVQTIKTILEIDQQGRKPADGSDSRPARQFPADELRGEVRDPPRACRAIKTLDTHGGST